MKLFCQTCSHNTWQTVSEWASQSKTNWQLKDKWRESMRKGFTDPSFQAVCPTSLVTPSWTAPSWWPMTSSRSSSWSPTWWRVSAFLCEFVPGFVNELKWTFCFQQTTCRVTSQPPSQQVSAPPSWHRRWTWWRHASWTQCLGSTAARWTVP